MLVRLCDAVAVLGTGLDQAVQLAARLEAPVKARVDAGAERSARLGEELRRLGAAEVEARRQSDEANERATTVQVDLARLEAEAEEAARASKPRAADAPAEGDDRAELAARAERLDARREELGKVNPLAKEEYEAEKERLDELATQRQDLEASLAEIAKLRDELAETVQRRFDETFETVARNFEEVAATLFPGGEGRLRSSSRRAKATRAATLEAGVEVELRPAGKRITRLSLLSGGEKALGAISFLFALFLAKPCPFYLLDEVEAALDDANVVPLRRAAAPLLRSGAVHRDHAPEAHDGGGRHPLRRHDGRRRRLAGRLPAAARARQGRPHRVARRRWDRPRTVLVTGGAGSSARASAGGCCSRRHVISLDNYFAGTRDNEVPDVDYREAHTRDIAATVPEPPDLVYHLGEYSRVEASLAEPDVVWPNYHVGATS